MKVIGWVASALGIAGVFTCNAATPVLWVLRFNLRSRASALFAIPAAGLEAAVTLSSSVADWLKDAGAGIDAVLRRAEALAGTDVADPAAAAALAAAIDAFSSGPYATLRTVYSALRERARAVSEAFDGAGRAVPAFAATDLVADRLRAIDARMEEIDTTMAALSALGPTRLAEPGVGAMVSERAALAAETLQKVGEAVSELEVWLHDGQERVAAAERRTGRALTIGALVGTALLAFAAGLNVLLFQQGRRWSRP